MGIYARAEKLFYDELSAVTDIESREKMREVLLGVIRLGDKVQKA